MHVRLKTAPVFKKTLIFVFLFSVLVTPFCLGDVYRSSGKLGDLITTGTQSVFIDTGSTIPLIRIDEVCFAKISYDALLKAPSPYDRGTSVPLIPQLERGPAPSGFCRREFWNKTDWVLR